MNETTPPSTFARAAAQPPRAPAPRNPAAPPAELEDLGRLAQETRLDSAQRELTLLHNEEIARLSAVHKRQVADLRNEIADLNKSVRLQSVRGRQRSTDQTRVGDLEIQIDALEVELAELRQQGENQRIEYTKQLTEERGIADRQLDNARREFREELGRHIHTHRAALVDYRTELDELLAQDRARHATALEAEHRDYERLLEAERERADAKVVAAATRHEREAAELGRAHQLELERQARQHKDTIQGLRGAGDEHSTQVQDLERENRALRVEVSTLQKQARQNEAEARTAIQRLTDDVAVLKAEADTERERNAALRSDVLRRSAEAHQTIDKAVAERTAQLSELEASVARQREYADTRVREISASAEDQARDAATREANLTATISRLNREIAELRAATDRQ